MSDAPKRIHAKPNQDEWLIGGWDTHGKAGGTEYVRADIADGLLAALDNLLDAITAEDRLGNRSLTITGATAALKWLIEARDDASAAILAARGQP